MTAFSDAERRNETDLLEGVDICTRANVFYEGRVVSHTIFKDGIKKTVGVYMPGEYTFETGDEVESDFIVCGEAEVLLPGRDWEKVDPGGHADYPPHTTFHLRCNTPVHYVCTYR